MNHSVKPIIFEEFLSKVKSCQQCASILPLGPNPVVQIAPQAKILIIGQAPGTKAHYSKLPFNDPSGDRLRSWLNVNREQFYNEHQFALMPMGFCYPGRNPKGGDLPPIPVCAPLWHSKVLGYLPRVQLVLLVGQYSQAYYLGNHKKKTLTETVRSWEEFAPIYFPLPHPSWRNTAWCRRNPWFESELIPQLQMQVQAILQS